MKEVYVIMDIDKFGYPYIVEILSDLKTVIEILEKYRNAGYDKITYEIAMV